MRYINMETQFWITIPMNFLTEKSMDKSLVAQTQTFIYLAMAMCLQKTHGTVFAAALVEEMGVDPDSVRWAIVHACRIERLEREKSFDIEVLDV